MSGHSSTSVQSVDLEPQEWQIVITALAMSNPVLVKISEQLSRQQRELVQGNAGNPKGNSNMASPSTRTQEIP